ncbi:serine/threonine protein kinase [Meiothermus sp. QL-1]|uniref:serine/threonine-protein kinase n=1 Tax=Meiothermus sp. QL-1 TaxID=2058095 RepID=UPI000E0BA75E|nr:serine/threonine-protein kinase [Meiothermus sp. QL-1]RDI95757.1 serine/threonine protein kinase [Meiothermus sp. QL-1]
MEPVKLADRYQLLAPLGEGGMAEVWKALDLRMDRPVAVKILHAYLHPSERQRFFQEVRALSRLSHPGVVQVFDLGEEAGRTYFVMELVEGGSYDRLGPFEDGMEGLRLLLASARVLEALAHLHARGVIHRDLTPRNILVTLEGQPKLMDLGLAYLMQESRHLTRTGITVGTPEYMAPEQAKGLPLTPQADLYSFGAVLYRTLTGKPLFEGENDQSVLYQHVYEVPAPPQARNPAVPPAVAELVLALLQKNPAERPASARAAHAVLEEALRTYREHLSATPRAGASRSGHYPSGPARPERLELAGTFDLAGQVAWPGELVAREGNLWVGAGQGLARLDLADGALHRYRLGDEVSAPPVVDGSRVYVAAWDGRLTALTLSGRPVLSFPTRAEITAAPLVAGLIYLPGRDGFLYALDASGTLRWGFQAGSELSAPPTLYRGLLFVAAESGWLFALDPETGRLRYKVETGPVHTAIPARGGLLFIPTWAGEIHAFDPLTREVQWSFDLEGELWGAPALDERNLYAASWAGKLYALNQRTGDVVWELKVGKVTAALSIAHGVLYLGTEEGRVLGVDAQSGRLVFEASGLGPIQVPPLPYRGALYVATLAGKLYRFA